MIHPAVVTVLMAVLMMGCEVSPRRMDLAGALSGERQAHFTNMQRKSGITFRHRPTHDSARHFKANHYDHGTGVLVADIDGDDLLDVYFLNQIGGNVLYKNLGHGKFKDVTKASHTGLAGRVCVGGALADIDNDGDQDLFVTTVRSGNILLQNNGKGVFADITEFAGLAYRGHSSGAVFFDFDRDGLLDLFLVNVGHYTTDRHDEQGYYVGVESSYALLVQGGFEEKSILYKNMGTSQFKDVTAAMRLDGLSGWNGDATITDYNHDHYPDLYIGNMEGDDHFFENVGGQYFAEVTDGVFPKTSWGTMGPKFFDFNNDLLIDLMTVDMHSDMMMDFAEEQEEMKLPVEFAKPAMGDISNNVLGNAFYKNLGNGSYEEISDAIGIETYWPWGMSVEDLNADGYQDIFVPSGMGYDFSYGGNVLLINQHGEIFKHAGYEWGIEPRANGNIINDIFGIDCGGIDKQRVECQPDFNASPKCVVNGACYKNGFITGARSSRSSAIFDMDNDGDLDMITGEFNDVPQVFVSNLAQRKDIHWLKVQLTGTMSNRSAIGARVELFYGDNKQVRYVDGKSGYLSQSQMPLYFGLGDGPFVDRIEVLWPSGKRQVIETGITANAVMKIVEQ